MPSLSSPPDLVLVNANVITLDRRCPKAELVAVKDDQIVWVGLDRDVGGSVLRGSRVIDCEGRTVLPGFIDSHCHVMAYASSLLAVDCSPTAVGSIDDIKRALSQRACHASGGDWIRGTGYDDFALAEKRHPTRQDLDEVVPTHPVRLNHRSGHACVLNSVALAQVGISSATPDPESGVIARDWSTGEPTGLLMEMDDYLEDRVPSLGESEFSRGVQLASQRLVSLGITSVQDATPSNSVKRWTAFGRLREQGVWRPGLTMLAGFGHLDNFLERGLHFGFGDGNLRLGAVKIMVTTTTGVLRPSLEELTAMVHKAHDSGFQVAVHAVEAEAVEAAARALLVGSEMRARDRIEHCSECLPDILDMLRRLRVVVVTQPSFLYYGGQRYLSEVPEDMWPWFYRINSFHRAGLRPSAGSDAPVVEPNPLVGIYTAVTRRAQTGETIGECERVPVHEAIRMYTINGANAALQERERGSIEVGKRADLTILEHDPTDVEADQIPHIKVMMTIIGGRVSWEA